MWSIAIHGGAGSLSEPAAVADCLILDRVLVRAERALAQGVAALDVVEEAIRGLEDSGNFVAGKGALPNTAGVWELDASICEGRSQCCGAVAALHGVYPPISIARAVMERTKNVLLVGEGAYAFARECGFAAIDDPSTFFLPSRSRSASADAPNHGTVGAVALDGAGIIAAGTSTGGISGKRPGRVGDSPIIGAGTWADGSVGVSCTGVGEFFLRAAAAHSVSAYYRLSGLDLGASIAAVLGDVAKLGGAGGLIAVDHRGNVTYAFNTDAMRVAVADSSGQRAVQVARRDVLSQGSGFPMPPPISG
jgi:L-asparaginase / beta-aspartyl-peptidase